MHNALIVACWVHIGAVMTLFGSSLFPLYACGGVGLARVIPASRDNDTSPVSGSDGAPASSWARSQGRECTRPAPEGRFDEPSSKRDGMNQADRGLPGFTAWSRPLLVIASVLALASALAWLVFEAGEMGDGPMDALNPHIIGMVLTETRFGMIWSGHLILSVALVATLIFAAPRLRLGIGLGLASLLLVSLAGVGHAVMATGLEGAVRLITYAVHLLAAGAWLGGLVPLAWVLKQARISESSNHAAQVLRRFSSLALMAVAMLIFSGLTESWFLVGHVEALISTPYGHILLLKLFLFAGILTLAAINRLVLMPRLLLNTLFRVVIAEQILGAGVVGVACLLGTLAPSD